MNQTSRLTFGRLALCALLLSASLLDSPVALPARAAVNAVRYVAPPPAGVYSGDCIAAPCATIEQANVQANPGDTISVAAGTYFENLQITKNLTVRGAGPDATFIDGGDIGPVIYIAGTDTNVTLTGMTIQHGNAGVSIYQYGGGIHYDGSGQLSVSAAKIISNTALAGGGIFSTGRLTLDGVSVLDNHGTGSLGGGGLSVLGVADLVNVTIANNTTSSGGGGGGIYNLGIMHITNVTLANNNASGIGGGLYNNSGTVTGTGGEIRNNQASYDGGGIYNALASAQLQLSAMTIKDNSSAQGSGGGVFNDRGSASFTRVTLSGNRAKGGGGIFNSAGGQLTLDNAWLKDNIAQTAAGGGISNEGTLDLTASTLSGNTASVLQGGGVRNAGSATLTLVTLSGNTTTSSDGGAIFADGGLVQIVSSTIVSNTDPGLKTVASGSLSLVNSIVVDRSGGPNCSGDVTSQGYNLETKNSCNFNQLLGDQINQSSPGVSPLRDNGGPTPTQALAFSSPATNNGTTDPATCQVKDQRGVVRPQPENGRCDIGAYEIIGFGNNATVPIPANECVTSAIAINASYAIGKLSVGVNATFDPRGDLRVTLVSPAGKRVALLGPTGGAAKDLDALFDDAAPDGVPGSGTNDTGSPYYENIYRPYDPLSALNNANIKGTWTLEACSLSAETGFLNSWLILVPEVSTSFRLHLPLIRR